MPNYIKLCTCTCRWQNLLIKCMQYSLYSLFENYWESMLPTCMHIMLSRIIRVMLWKSFDKSITLFSVDIISTTCQAAAVLHECRKQPYYLTLILTTAFCLAALHNLLLHVLRLMQYCCVSTHLSHFTCLNCPLW